MDRTVRDDDLKSEGIRRSVSGLRTKRGRFEGRTEVIVVRKSYRCGRREEILGSSG